MDPRNVHARIIGEHGDSEIAAWSTANVSGIPVNDFCELRGHFDHDESMQRIAEDVKNSAYEIIAKKKATYYGIAMSVKRICEAIVRDEKPILPVSNFQRGVHGLHDVVLSMPAVVGKDGIEYQVPAPLSADELARLHPPARIRGDDAGGDERVGFGVGGAQRPPASASATKIRATTAKNGTAIATTIQNTRTSPSLLRNVGRGVSISKESRKSSMA